MELEKERNNREEREQTVSERCNNGEKRKRKKEEESTVGVSRWEEGCISMVDLPVVRWKESSSERANVDVCVCMKMLKHVRYAREDEEREDGERVIRVHWTLMRTRERTNHKENLKTYLAPLV